MRSGRLYVNKQLILELVIESVSYPANRISEYILLKNELKRGKKTQLQMCDWVVARLPQRLKSTFFDIFSHSGGSFGAAPLEKNSKIVDFSL